MIETRYNIGDRVWVVEYDREVMQRDCPDCHGTKKWKAISPAGQEYEFTCPRCSQTYYGNDRLRLDYIAIVARPRQVTVGKIDAEVWDGKIKETYQCNETGVIGEYGGGARTYGLEDIFGDEESARIAGEIGALKQFAENGDGYMVALFDRAVTVCDYQLRDAELWSQGDVLRKQKYLLEAVIEDLESELEYHDCDMREYVKQRIDEFREREGAI